MRVVVSQTSEQCFVSCRGSGVRVVVSETTEQCSVSCRGQWGAVVVSETTEQCFVSCRGQWGANGGFRDHSAVFCVLQDKSWRVRYNVAQQLTQLCEGLGPELARQAMCRS